MEVYVFDSEVIFRHQLARQLFGGTQLRGRRGERTGVAQIVVMLEITDQRDPEHVRMPFGMGAGKVFGPSALDGAVLQNEKMIPDMVDMAGARIGDVKSPLFMQPIDVGDIDHPAADPVSMDEFLADDGRSVGMVDDDAAGEVPGAREVMPPREKHPCRDAQRHEQKQQPPLEVQQSVLHGFSLTSRGGSGLLVPGHDQASRSDDPLFDGRKVAAVMSLQAL